MEIEKKAYTLGIIARELNIDFDRDISAEQMAEINKIMEDVLLDEPKTDLGKTLKEVVEKEKQDENSEHNQAFNFQKDLQINKVKPGTIFIAESISKYIDSIIDGDEKAEAEMLSDIVNKLNELDFPIGYIQNPFNLINSVVAKLNASLKGQIEHREDEIKALSIGKRHPKYETLSPHLSSLKDMDKAIKKLRKTFNFTEEDYRK